MQKLSPGQKQILSAAQFAHALPCALRTESYSCGWGLRTQSAVQGSSSAGSVTNVASSLSCYTASVPVTPPLGLLSSAVALRHQRTRGLSALEQGCGAAHQSSLSVSQAVPALLRPSAGRAARPPPATSASLGPPVEPLSQQSGPPTGTLSALSVLGKFARLLRGVSMR